MLIFHFTITHMRARYFREKKKNKKNFIRAPAYYRVVPEDEALRKLNHIHLLTYLTAAPAATPLSLSSVSDDFFFLHLSLNELNKT